MYFVLFAYQKLLCWSLFCFVCILLVSLQFVCSCFTCSLILWPLCSRSPERSYLFSCTTVQLAGCLFVSTCVLSSLLYSLGFLFSVCHCVYFIVSLHLFCQQFLCFSFTYSIWFLVSLFCFFVVIQLPCFLVLLACLSYITGFVAGCFQCLSNIVGFVRQVCCISGPVVKCCVLRSLFTSVNTSFVRYNLFFSYCGPTVAISRQRQVGS